MAVCKIAVDKIAVDKTAMSKIYGVHKHKVECEINCWIKVPDEWFVHPDEIYKNV